MNLYALIVGPAGGGKSVAIRYATKLLEKLDVEIADENVAGMKRIDPFVGKATAERLITIMQPKERRGENFTLRDKDGNPLIGKDGKPVVYKKTSEIALLLSEMSVAVGKQSYMDGLLELLLTFYDCEDYWYNETQVRDKEELRNLHTTLMAALTPVALKESLPTQITGDGFLSRAVIVYQWFADREHPRPTIPEGAPSRLDLKQRLAWIASNTFGPWDLAPDAEDFYTEWYHNFKIKQMAGGLYAGIISRHRDLVLKLACLIAWAEYTRAKNIIQKRHLEAAAYLLDRTFAEAKPMYRLILNTQANDRTVQVENFIKRATNVNGGCTRQDICVKGHIVADDVTAAVIQLVQEGAIRIVRDGKDVAMPSRSTNEQYIYVAAQKELQWPTLTGRNKSTTMELEEKKPIGRPAKERQPGSGGWQDVLRSHGL